jgi:hypothetical protein
MKQGERRLIEARYYNANYYATVIVASITEGIDWAAYIGGAPDDMDERNAIEFVAQHGCKLSRKDAKYYFPEIELPYRL